MPFTWDLTVLTDTFRSAAISASVPVKDNLDCGQVDKPIPVMIINGTADPINPFRGGMVSLGSAKLGNVLVGGGDDLV